MAPAVIMLLLLAGCMPKEAEAPAFHEIFLYGFENARYGYFYGSPTTLTIDGSELELSEGRTQGKFVVPGALFAGGAPFLRRSLADIAPPTEVQRIPLTTDLELQASQQVGPVVYFDGRSWFTLVESAEEGVRVRIAPKPRLARLRGLGQLTREEADAYADLLEQRGPLVVTVLPEEMLERRSIDGLSEYLLTGLYVQVGVTTDTAAFQPPAQSLQWEVLARGSQATGYQAPTFVLVSDEDKLIGLWNRAYGSQLTIPPLPEVDFEHETLLAVFLGSKPTGGYGVVVDRVSVEGGDLFVDMRQTSPAEGTVTTQALTSPWLMLRVLRGGFDVAWFRDPEADTLIGVARRFN